MNTYQMVNRDTGLVVYQAEARGWRQFKIAYAQWAQTNQQGILILELQEIRRVEPKAIEFDDKELKLIGRCLEQCADTSQSWPQYANARKLAERIEAHLKGTS